MRRIRATASGVALEIGLSREAVNNWRKGASMPSPRSREKLLACANYLRLSELETNKLFEAAGFEHEFSLQAEYTDAIPFSSFINDLFYKLELLIHYPILLLLCQAHWGQPPFRNELLQRARDIYGEEQVLHIQPPFSLSNSSESYFAAIGRQCGFKDINSDYEFEAALEQKLLDTNKLFLLVSRFEQGVPELRESLAGILRSLSEMHEGKLRLLLCGGEALADLKYKSGSLSLLNIAQVCFWPDITTSDLTVFASKNWPNYVFATPILQKLLQITGGHPILLLESIQWFINSKNIDRLDEQQLSLSLENSEQLWQIFLSLVEIKQDRVRMIELLNKEALAQAQPYISDPFLRKLFWSNLIAVKGAGVNAKFYWRCEIIREIGRKILKDDLSL